MCQIAIDIPEEVLYDTKMNTEEASEFARRMVAVGYYTQNKVSLGYCAQIAGMSKEDFIKYLGRHHILPLLDEMKRNDFYISSSLEQFILQQADE